MHCLVCNRIIFLFINVLQHDDFERNMRKTARLIKIAKVYFYAYCYVVCVWLCVPTHVCVCINNCLIMKLSLLVSLYIITFQLQMIYHIIYSWFEEVVLLLFFKYNLKKQSPFGVRKTEQRYQSIWTYLSGVHDAMRTQFAFHMRQTSFCS